MAGVFILGFAAQTISVTAQTHDQKMRDLFQAVEQAPRSGQGGRYTVQGFTLGRAVGNGLLREFKCQPSDQFAQHTWCSSFVKAGSGRSASSTRQSILLGPDGTAQYINHQATSSDFSPKEIEGAVKRRSAEFGAKPRLISPPQQLRALNPLMAIWGNIQLEELAAADRAALASGRSPRRGFLVDFLNDIDESVKRGFPVYRLAEGAGYIWILSFDGDGTSRRRSIAIDTNALAPPPLVTSSIERNDQPRRAEVNPTPNRPISSGTGIIISRDGHVLTNHHVIDDCASLQVMQGGELPAEARLLRADPTNDIAILKISRTFDGNSVAKFRKASSIRPGEGVAVYGFPLAGTLSTSGNIVAGNVTSLAGLEDDARFLQISAPVQPGNSGGPLLDRSGGLVGVVTARISDLAVVEATGVVPQNVNFALKANVVMNFLEAHSIPIEATEAQGGEEPLTDIAEKARKFTAQVTCR